MRALKVAKSPEVEEIGDGILALRWPKENHFSIFYDNGRWKLAESYWMAMSFPYLARTGVLPGMLFNGGITAASRAWEIARLMLSPTADHYMLADDVRVIIHEHILDTFKR